MDRQQLQQHIIDKKKGILLNPSLHDEMLIAVIAVLTENKGYNKQVMELTHTISVNKETLELLSLHFPAMYREAKEKLNIK